MYTALLGCLTTPGLDGMRFALVLFKFSVFETFTESRFPEQQRVTVVPSLSSPADLAGNRKPRSRGSADVGIALAISNLVLLQTWTGGLSAGSARQQRWSVGFVLDQHGPSHSCQFVCQSNDGDVLMGSRCELRQPGT